MPAAPTLERPTDLEFRSLGGTFERLRAAEGATDDAVRYAFTASSEAAVEMWRGLFEVLDHAPQCVRLDWLNSGNAPALWMHDRNESRGVIESARLEADKLRVVVRMSPNATALVADIDAGVIRNVSIGYRIYDEKIDARTSNPETGEILSTTWRVIDWEPREVSFVTIPADRTVGLGRSENEDAKCRVRFLEQKAQADPSNTSPTRQAMPAEPPTAPTITVTESEKARTDAVTAERERIAGIHSAAESARKSGFGDFAERAQEAIEKNESLADFQRHVLANMKRTDPVSTHDLGLSEKEAKRFSLVNLIDGMSQGDMKRCEFELEVSRAAQQANGHGNSERICIPVDVLLRGYMPKNPALAARLGEAQRTLISVSLAGGGQNTAASNLVPRELMADLFIESLRESTVLLSEATILQGLIGDVDIPIELTNPSFYWVGEDEEPTEGGWTSGQVQFRFKTLGARIPVTRRALKQSTPNVESVLANNLRRGAAIALEAAAFYGTGSATRPAGILNTNGIGDVASAAGFAFAHVLELRSDVAGANAPTANHKFFTNSKGVSKLRGTAIEAGDARRIGEYVNGVLIVEGKPVLETNLVPSTLGAGTDKSAILYGDPSSVYVGMWGGLELAVDTTTKANTGGKVLRVFQDADIKIPQPARWSAIQDLTA